jgi:hypothetical protein
MSRLTPDDPRIEMLISEVKYMQALVDCVNEARLTKQGRDALDEIDTHLRLLIDYMLMDPSDPRLRRVNESRGMVEKDISALKVRCKC